MLSDFTTGPTIRAEIWAVECAWIKSDEIKLEVGLVNISSVVQRLVVARSQLLRTYVIGCPLLFHSLLSFNAHFLDWVYTSYRDHLDARDHRLFGSPALCTLLHISLWLKRYGDTQEGISVRLSWTSQSLDIFLVRHGLAPTRNTKRRKINDPVDDASR